MDTKKLVNEYKNYTIELRREFHSFPEPSLQEFETVKRIERELNNFKIPYKIVGETGIVATIQGNKEGKKIALRGDIDALELDDKKNTKYKSKNPGLAHACGHDGHTAMLLTAGGILINNKDSFDGTIYLIFQPAEESIAGAKKMMEDKNFPKDLDGILGIHLIVDIPTGSMGYCPGACMSSADSFIINIQGKGGHGSSPHQAIDSALATCALVMNSQHIISREISPAEFGVITFGVVRSGSRNNIIADTGLLEGTIRTYNNKVRQTLKNALQRVAKSVCEAYRVSYTIEFPDQTSAVLNDKYLLEMGLNTSEKIFGKENIIQIPPVMGSEDFSYYLEKTKGIYIMVGCGNKEKGIIYPHHHPMFDIDEDALLYGTRLYIDYAIDFLM